MNDLSPVRQDSFLTSARRWLTRSVAPGEAVDQDDPLRDLRAGAAVIFAFFVLFLGWAALARVDAAVTARGTIVVSGNRQEVQHKEGGVVTALHVREGDHVEKGQVLIDLAGDDTEARANALIAQYIDLRAREARLLTEQVGASNLQEPSALMEFDGAYRRQIDEALAIQRKALEADRTFLSTQLSVLDQRIAEMREQIEGDNQQMAANQRQQSLTQDELVGVQDLQKKGYAPMTRVRSLEQSIAALQGDYAALQGHVASTEASIGETRMQALSLRKQQEDKTVSDLSDVQAQLKAMEPQMAAARTSYDRLHIRATATGKVMGLSVFTVGGVVAPGQKLMDIVPDNTSLVIQAMIDAKDGDDVHPGEMAQVKFVSLNERDIPILKGRVLDVSGDSFTDKDSGHAFYTARVEIGADAVRTLDRVAGKARALKPGLPVEIVVATRKRTVLQYLTEPLNQSLWKTFRES